MKSKLLAAALVFLLATAVYLPTIGHSFQFDDELFLRDGNVAAGNWQAFVLPPVPRALTWLTFLLQRGLGHRSPFLFRAFNITLHGLNAVLVFLLLAGILSRPEAGSNGGGGIRRALSSAGPAPRDQSHKGVAAATFGAALFALHPIQSEPVLLVYQRSTLLAAFFGFLGLLIWMGGGVRRAGLGSVRTRSSRDWMRSAAVFACFLLALASKEFVAVFPLVLWCHDGLLLEEWKPRGGLAAMLGLGAVFVLSSLAWAAEPVAVDWRNSLTYAATQVRVWWLYLFLILGLVPQNVDHAVAAQATLWDWRWWSALAGLAVAAGSVWRFRRSHPRGVFFAAVFGLFLLPTSSLLPSPDFMFEHRVYASMLGIAGLAASGLRGGVRRWPSLRAPLAAGVALVVVLAAAATLRRAQVWRSPVALWSDAAAKSPQKYRTQFNLGVALADVDPQAAARALSRAVTIDPGQPLAYRALGELKLRIGDRRAARTFWEQARLLEPADWRTWTALGTIHLLDRDYRLASERLSEAVRLAPTEAEPRLQSAHLNLQFGFVKEAIRQAQAGLEWNPDSLELTLALADAVAADLNWKRAEELYRRALEIDAARVQAHYGLARALFGQSRRVEGREAVRLGLLHASSPAERQLGERLLQRSPQK